MDLKRKQDWGLKNTFPLHIFKSICSTITEEIKAMCYTMKLINTIGILKKMKGTSRIGQDLDFSFFCEEPDSKHLSFAYYSVSHTTWLCNHNAKAVRQY